MKLFLVLPKLILLILAFGLDIYALQLLVHESIVMNAVIFHFSASAVFAYVFPQFLTFNDNQYRLKAGIFFFVIAFYLPLLGSIGLTSAIPLIIRHSSRPKDSSKDRNLLVNLNKIRNLPVGKTLVPYVNPINIKDLYRSRNPDKRLAAIYATLKLKDQDAVPLLRMALRDSVDDIRLLAYALLDRKEHNLSKRIKNLRQALVVTERSKRKLLYRRITSDYWELVRLGLVQGEARNYMLNTACEYIERGLKHDPKDAGLRILYAQILLKLGQYQPAYEQFKEAENLGIERKRLLTYYAEIALYSHQYQEVKQFMNAIDLPAAYPQLSTAARFWRKDN